MGLCFQYGDGVTLIERQGDGTFNVHLRSGARHHVRTVLFNGDPAALGRGLLGPDVTGAVKMRNLTARALSAWVWAFAAQPRGRDLAHHNVFFNTHYHREFQAIESDEMPADSALYVCAQDRSGGATPGGIERFEIILNGPAATPGRRRDLEEYRKCLTHTFTTLSGRGLHFDQIPNREALSSPSDFAARFPGSDGSLYGQSPHGMLASFRRPLVRSRIPGLYLAGGGVHPGAGLPMAATSGRLAAEAILKDLALTSRSRRTAMPGGMSTGFRTVAPTVSRSSGFIGSVFSPWYRWYGRKSPHDHVCINVALYGPGGRFTMTERSRGALRQSRHRFQVGPSSMEWRDGMLVIDVDEISNPLICRVRGQIRLHPRGVTDIEMPLKPDGNPCLAPLCTDGTHRGGP